MTPSALVRRQGIETFRLSLTYVCVRVDPISGSTPAGQPGLTSLCLIKSYRAIGVVTKFYF